MARRRGRPENPLVPQFRERLEWIVHNLDSYPGFARNIHEVDAVYDAYATAVERQTFPIISVMGEGAYPSELPRRAPLAKSRWKFALSDDRPSKEFIDWLDTLYPDLERDRLLSQSLSDFLEWGESISQAREEWEEPVRFFSKNRKILQEVSLEFYTRMGQVRYVTKSGYALPLLTRDGWIRRSPLELKETTETPTLKKIREAKEAPCFQLLGLKGQYITYRGKIGYPAREKVNKEPQHNGEIFCAEEIICDELGFVGFEYRIGSYFDYINTGEVLGVELADWVLKKGRNSIPNSLPFRGEASDAFCLTNRAAYPGVNCLSVLLNYSSDKFSKERGNYFLLHKRDETQMQAQNSVHVIPAGGHQGLSAAALKEDTAIWRTLVREFAEELFDKENLSRQSPSWIDFLAHRDIRAIKTLFDTPDPAVRPYILGFGLDPITLKPEVLCVEVIDWELARKRMRQPKLELRFNWEVQTEDPDVTRAEFRPLTRALLIEYATERKLRIGDTFLDPLPAGAACMLLTEQHFDELGLTE